MIPIKRPWVIFICFFVILKVTECSNNLQGPTHAAIGSETCMRILGCFKVTKEFFHLFKRPINLLPQNRALINTKFLLYTNRNIRETHFLDAEKKETITSSHYDPDLPTKFIIHGYIDTQGYGPWQEKLKDEFLLKGKHNVIIVDWSGGNGLPYTQATANTRVVGAEVAYLIKTLQAQVGLKLKNVHILGHSLGAHIAGYAGERLPGLGRITGLDPAEPYFQDLPPLVRLDETDADFVDVIHTDSKSILLLGLGMSQAIGHVDFYPNGGTNQPGCKKEKITSFITEGITEGLRRFIACSHQRAVDFYQSSIVLTRCAPVAYECSTWENFLEGKCTECGPGGSKCAIFGDKAIQSKDVKGINKKYYLQTSDKKPYCMYHYKVIIKLYKAKDSIDEKGTLALKFNSESKTSVAKLSTGSLNLYGGSSYVYLLTSKEDFGKLRSVSFVWKSSGIILNPLNWFKKPKINIDYIKVVPMNIVDQGKKMEVTETFCPSNREKAINSGASAVFTRDVKC